MVEAKRKLRKGRLAAMGVGLFAVGTGLYITAASFGAAASEVGGTFSNTFVDHAKSMVRTPIVEMRNAARAYLQRPDKQDEVDLLNRLDYMKKTEEGRQAASPDGVAKKRAGDATISSEQLLHLTKETADTIEKQYMPQIRTAVGAKIQRVDYGDGTFGFISVKDAQNKPAAPQLSR